MGASSSVPETSIHEFTVKVCFFVPLYSSDIFFWGNFLIFFFFFHFIFGDFEQDSKGKDVNLDCYKGKVLLVVNVASKW